MPIDKRQSHGNIVKELLDEYKKSGKIGNTHPRDLDHARSIANAIAYKAKEEAVLEEIRRVNEKEAEQLTFDFQRNIDNYLQDVAKQNEEDISNIVNKFMAAYLAVEKNRLKSINRPVDLPKLRYDNSHIIYSAISTTKIPVGYNQRLGALNALSASRAALRTNHFHCRMQDSNLIVTINSEYLTAIKMTVKDLGG